MQYLIVLLLPLVISGCSVLQSPIKPREIIVRTVTVPVEIYQPPAPREMELRPVEGAVVITKDNWEEKIAEVENLLGGDFVVIAYVPKAYENISWNLQEMRRYIKQQREIVLYYQKVTTVSKDLDNDGDVDIDDWIIENKKVQQNQIDSDS